MLKKKKQYDVPKCTSYSFVEDIWFLVIGIEPKELHMSGKPSTTIFLAPFAFKRKVLRLAIFLFLPLGCWYYRNVSPHSTREFQI
jgi:hypothetical protein